MTPTLTPAHTVAAPQSGSFTAAEFFAGIGLVRVALESRGWRVAFANDIDPGKRKMYADVFGDDHLRPDSIRDLRGDDIPDCTLCTSSFPCNDLSIAGGKKGLSGERSGLFWEFVRILDEMGSRKPPLVLLENVVGFLSSHGGRDFAAALVALNEVGYACDAIILDAAHFTPQSRKRLFVVATQDAGDDKDEFALRDDDALRGESAVRPAALQRFIRTHDEVRWKLRPLPAPPHRVQTVADILDPLADDDPAWWNADRAAYFRNQLSDRHAAWAEDMIGGDDYSYATAFRRVRKGRSMAELRTDGLAGCLRTPRGGSGRQILMKAGRGRFWVRLLTARECARLQGVPEDYKIDVPLNQALFGFGDAVCVPAVEWILDHYLTPLAAAL